MVDRLIRLIEQERMQQIWTELEDETKQLNVPVIEGLEMIIRNNSAIFAVNHPVYNKVIAVSPIYLNQERYPEQVRLWSNSESFAYTKRADGKVDMFLELIPQYPNIEQIEKMFELHHLLRKEPSIEDYAKQYFRLILRYSEEYIKLCYQKNRLAHARNIAALRDLHKRMDESIAKFRKEK